MWHINYWLEHIFFNLNCKNICMNIGNSFHRLINLESDNWNRYWLLGVYFHWSQELMLSCTILLNCGELSSLLIRNCWLMEMMLMRLIESHMLKLKWVCMHSSIWHTWNPGWMFGSQLEFYRLSQIFEASTSLPSCSHRKSSHLNSMMLHSPMMMYLKMMVNLMILNHLWFERFELDSSLYFTVMIQVEHQNKSERQQRLV